MPILVVILPFVAFVTWMVSIRPYCLRHQQGYTTGANWGVTMWVDWQQAKEIAKKERNRTMIAVCRAFFLLHLGFASAVLWMILKSGLIAAR